MVRGREDLNNVVRDRDRLLRPVNCPEAHGSNWTALLDNGCLWLLHTEIIRLFRSCVILLPKGGYVAVIAGG